ncbi:MAG: O-antigen ligase family protein, partial [Anaerolineales bacterium]
MDADQKSHFAHLLQLAATLLVALYMLLIGGSFDATVRFRVQLLNALAAGVLALAWLIIRLRQRARLAHTGRELSLLAFVLSQWVAAGTSAQPRLSFEFAASVTAWSIAFLILCDVLASGWPRSYVLHALVLAAFIIAAQALWEVAAWFALWAGLGQLPPTAFRLNGFLGHPNLTAAALNLLLPLVIAQMLMARKTITRLALGALALAMLAAEFFSSSRAGWIAGGATLGLMAGLLAWERREQIGGWALRWRRWPLPVRLGSFTFALGLLAAGGWLFVRQSQHATHGSLLFSRQGFWLPAWNLFLAHPLTGAGPELYPWFFPLSYSIPPDEVIPHPHSLIFQLLSGSGLIGLGAALGLGAAGALRLWRRWQDGPDRLWTAAFASSLFGVFVHHLFDYFFSTPAFVFLFVVVSALAFAPDLTPPPSPFRRGGQLHPSLLALPLALMMGITAFSLRGAALNDQGLQLATQGNWAGAARAFQRAAELDPGLTLYWAEAAQAATRAGDAQSALPLWQRARHDDPNWAVWPATLAVLTGDPAAMQPAQQLAPRSDLFALNAGALAEAAGDPVAA